jgi:hypothetical protein
MKIWIQIEVIFLETWEKTYFWQPGNATENIQPFSAPFLQPKKGFLVF